jgi:hypothetical protein
MIDAKRAAIPQMRDRFRTHGGWIEAQLGDNREWLLGEFNLADINAYMNIWYMRVHLSHSDGMILRLPRTVLWAKRMQAIGHGSRREITGEEALEIATQATSQTRAVADPDDANGRQPGHWVSVAPDDYGRVEVRGQIVSLSAQHIATLRSDERAGEIVVHFPRAGFAVIAS